MEILVGLHEMFDKAGGVATADDSGVGVGFFTDHFGGDGGSGGVSWIFGVA